MNTQDFAALYNRFSHSGLLSEILDQSHAAIMVLDGDRKLVYCTQTIVALSHAGSVEELLGRRPGDFLHCVSAGKPECGEGELCGDCGAYLGICAGLGGWPGEQDCALVLYDRGRLETRNFRVRVMPMVLDERRYVALSLQDCSHETRCRELERVFLHDILNTVGAIKGILHFVHGDMTGDNRELLDIVMPYFDLCVNEISAQQKLLAAENNELDVSMERFSLGQLLHGLTCIHAQHALGKDKDIRVELGSGTDEVISDRTIIHRIAMNLIKNALEATPAGGTIRIAGIVEDGLFRISVRNPGVMPGDVQKRLLRRPVSTKGPGRGLGVQSVNLLCTNYLHGRVWFESAGEETAFHVEIPQGQALEQG